MLWILNLHLPNIPTRTMEALWYEQSPPLRRELEKAAVWGGGYTVTHSRNLTYLGQRRVSEDTCFILSKRYSIDNLPNYVCQSLSHVRLFATPWTAAHQAPLSMGFSSQEYWGGLPCPPPGDLPKPGIEPGSQADFLLPEPHGKPITLLKLYLFGCAGS